MGETSRESEAAACCLTALDIDDWKGGWAGVAVDARGAWKVFALGSAAVAAVEDEDSAAGVDLAVAAAGIVELVAAGAVSVKAAVEEGAGSPRSFSVFTLFSSSDSIALFSPTIVLLAAASGDWWDSVIDS